MRKPLVPQGFRGTRRFLLAWAENRDFRRLRFVKKILARSAAEKNILEDAELTHGIGCDCGGFYVVLVSDQVST
jgi:hypothetical protein